MSNFSLSELYKLSKNGEHKVKFNLLITKELNDQLVSIYPATDISPLVCVAKYAKAKGYQDTVVPVLPLLVHILPTVEKELLGTNLIGIGTTGTNFRKPIFVGDTVSIEGILLSVSRATRIVTFEVRVNKNEELIADGIWKMRVLPEN